MFVHTAVVAHMERAEGNWLRRTCTSLMTTSYLVLLSFQNALEIKVEHHGYSDPNNLMFTEIKVLGVPTTVQQVNVTQNGVIIPSAHVLSYDSSKQVRCRFWGHDIFTTACVLLNVWRFSCLLNIYCLYVNIYICLSTKRIRSTKPMLVKITNDINTHTKKERINSCNLY